MDLEIGAQYHLLGKMLPFYPSVQGSATELKSRKQFEPKSKWGFLLPPQTHRDRGHVVRAQSASKTVVQPLEYRSCCRSHTQCLVEQRGRDSCCPGLHWLFRAVALLLAHAVQRVSRLKATLSRWRSLPFPGEDKGGRLGQMTWGAQANSAPPGAKWTSPHLSYRNWAVGRGRRRKDGGWIRVPSLQCA